MHNNVNPIWRSAQIPWFQISVAQKDATNSINVFKGGIYSGDLMNMKQAKKMFRMDFHGSVRCLCGDGDLRYSWTVCLPDA